MIENKFRAWDAMQKRMYYDVDLNQMGSKNTIYMQYSGLKDSQGYELYEGDILAYYDEDLSGMVEGVLWFKNGRFVMIDDYGYFYHPSEIERSELIGNIFQDGKI